MKACRLRFPPWGLRPVQGVCTRATAQLHQSIPHLHFTLHKCHEGLWLPKRANIPCLSKHLEACHSFVPGIPVPLSCPHVRATASIPKNSGPPAPLIQVAGRMPHFGLPPHSPSPVRDSSRGSWPPLTPCAFSLLWRSENAGPFCNMKATRPFPPLVRGVGVVVTVPLRGKNRN